MRKSHGRLPEGDHGVHESEGSAKKHILRRRTLQEIAAALSTKGLKEAVERYESYLTPPTNNYAIVDDHSRRRTTLRRQGGGDLDYIWHGPPSWFDPRYVILEVTVGAGGNVDFMTHAGEELLYVMPEREITYEFFWPNRKPPWFGTIPNSGIRVSDGDKKVTVPPGYLIRINSALLHRNTTAHPGGATLAAPAKAWIILQSPAGPAALLVHPHAEDSPVGSFRKSTETRRKFEEDGIPFLRAFKKDDLELWIWVTFCCWRLEYQRSLLCIGRGLSYQSRNSLRSVNSTNLTFHAWNVVSLTMSRSPRCSIWQHQSTRTYPNL